MNCLLGVWLATAPARADTLDSLYLIMVDRYANGDTTNDADADPDNPISFHGGDLRGIIDHLDHIESLGVRTVWLTPITEMRTDPIGSHGAFHGYWTDRGETLEPRFGTDADLIELKEGLHKRGMKLVLEVVLNHVGPETTLEKTHPDWFHSFGDITDWKDEQQLRTHDVHGLPDLAQEKEDVAKHLIDQSLEWVRRFDPDGLRIDAVRHIDSGFLSRYTTALKDAVDRPFALIGEVFDGNPETVARETTATGLTHAFDFPLHFSLIDGLCRGGDLRKIAVVLTQDRLHPDPDALITFLDNHDTPRIRTVCDSPEQVKAAIALITSIRGIPSFTWGTSAGLQGQTEAEARGDMVFGDGPFHQTMKEHLHQRRENAALIQGQTDILSAAEHSLVFARVLASEAVVVAVGSSDQPVLPAVAGTAAWQAIPGDGLNRWSLKPTEPNGFSKWAQAIANSREQTRTIRLRSGPDASFVGSGPALGSWKPEQARGRGQVDVNLPAGGWVAVKTIRTTEGGETQWSPHPDVFIDVDAVSQRGEPVQVPY